jgi:hypothetical protein
MRKINVIFLFLIIVLTGCSNKNENNLEDELDNIDYTYNQNIVIKSINSVELFDSIYLTDERELDIFTKKNTIFDLELTKELTINSVSLRSSDNNQHVSNDPKELTYLLSTKSQYKESKYFIEAYFVNDFSMYLNQDFMNDIVKLENDETSSEEVFNKYGTHVVLSIIKGFYHELYISLDSKSISEDEFYFIVKYLSEYTNDKYKNEDIDKYNELSKKCNMEVMINSNYIGDTYFDILNKINNQNYNYSYFIANEGYLPIWKILNDEHIKAKELLQNYYNANILEID